MPDDFLENIHDNDDHPSSVHSTPRSRSSSHDDHQKSPSKKNRVVHHYQAGSDLLPFELSRNRNTDWIAAGGPALLLTYIFIVLVALLTFLAFIPEPKVAWTLTNIVHMLVTLMYLHWIKGNPADYMDGTQGEMNAMTLWEQIISTPAAHSYNSASVGIMSSKKRGSCDNGRRGQGFRERRSCCHPYTPRSCLLLCVQFRDILRNTQRDCVGCCYAT
eukprot:CCRYP_014743-RC/>CCRYP_014743-RC protein AED:0.32 eAED:0.32 QI:0/-1/0/1/-1/1/1/0/216